MGREGEKGENIVICGPPSLCLLQWALATCKPELFLPPSPHGRSGATPIQLIPWQMLIANDHFSQDPSLYERINHSLFLASNDRSVSFLGPDRVYECTHAVVTMHRTMTHGLVAVFLVRFHYIRLFVVVELDEMGL